jgi:signal transduction histidine kinase
VPVVIEDVIVNGKSEAAGAEMLRLSPGPKNLEFRYTALSFLAPGRITFRYRLEGFDRDWVEAGARREAFYTNLPPGDYRFRVAAVNVDQTTNESGAGAVALAIAPHFYQRRLFWPLCAGVAAAGVWAAYRVRVGRIKERMRTVVAERSRIARELHDTLLQGFSGVTMEMQALAARLPATSTEREALEEIIRDAGACMREARRSVAGLRSAASPETGVASGLAAAIGQAARQITETRDVRLKLDLPAAPVTGLAADVEYNLLRIAAEAVANAARHAGAGTIEVALAPSGNRLELSVKDDGVGFSVDGNGGGEHYGLVGMRERAAQIGAEFELTSEPGRGTTVRVRLALSGPARDGVELLRGERA